MHQHIEYMFPCILHFSEDFFPGTFLYKIILEPENKFQNGRTLFPETFCINHTGTRIKVSKLQDFISRDFLIQGLFSYKIRTLFPKTFLHLCLYHFLQRNLIMFYMSLLPSYKGLIVPFRLQYTYIFKIPRNTSHSTVVDLVYLFHTYIFKIPRNTLHKILQLIQFIHTYIFKILRNTSHKTVVDLIYLYLHI